MLVSYYLGFSSIMFPMLAFAGDVSEGGTCSPTNDRLDPSTHNFLGDCSDTTFCSAPSNSIGSNTSSSPASGSINTNWTCQPRHCRRDEFPFGYGEGQPLPPLCSTGSFCPDEGSGCKQLVGPGQTCQLNRDDQCAPPPNWQNLANNWNFNGSICLRSTCVYANVSLGHTCIVDNVTYIDSGPDGQQYSNSITRDNCQTPRLYCDRNSTQCVPTKGLGAECNGDQECQSYNCGIAGVCVDPPEMPLHVAGWQYTAVAFGVLAVMVTTIVMLILLHKRLRLKRYREIREYYEEQTSLRYSIAALHAAAAERYEDEKDGCHGGAYM